MPLGTPIHQHYLTIQIFQLLHGGAAWIAISSTWCFHIYTKVVGGDRTSGYSSLFLRINAARRVLMTLFHVSSLYDPVEKPSSASYGHVLTIFWGRDAPMGAS